MTTHNSKRQKAKGKLHSLLFFFLLSPLVQFACHNSTINSVNSTANGNGTTTYTINVSIDVGSFDGYSYGFALQFTGSCGTPVVQPGFTPQITRSGYNPLVGYTGAAIGSGGSTNLFALRYGNMTNVLTYESNDDMWGFGSTDYNNNNIIVTVAGCVETITLDADIRSLTATNAPNAQCLKTQSTGATCAGTAPVTGFSYASPVCANAVNPSPTGVAGFTTGGLYSSAAGLSINASTGQINLASSTPGTYTVTYSVAASGCTPAGSNTTGITITPSTTPTTGFSYPSPVCANAANPSPTGVAGFTTGGTYSSTAGLSINASTGLINLASSTAGTYTVTYSVPAIGCIAAGTSTASITITSGGAPTTGFSYTSPVCANATNPSPTGVAGFTNGGTYSSTAGLSINASTGLINLASTTPGTYTVTYSVAASGCSTAGSSTTSITITPSTTPTTGFSYPSPVCANAANPSPTGVAGFTTGGTYSSTAGLSINASTGLINLASSTAGTYTVTYTVAASGCMVAGTNTASITITNGGTPTTGFSYTSPVCANATNPSPTGVAGFTSGGTYSSAAGLSINTSTGQINLASSTPGTYTVSYSVAASGCSTAGSSTTSITITPSTAPTTGFSYPSPVCANATNPSPTGVAGFTTGGTYSSTAGLSINASTGLINLASSTAGTYTVTYTVAASGCMAAGTNTASITITNGGAPTTGFSYTSPICVNAANPSPTGVAGFTSGGTYSSTAGLSINASTGLINLASSTPGTYTVTYSVAASGCISAGSSNSSVSIITPPSQPSLSLLDTVCAGSSNSISVTNPVSGFSYNWNATNGILTGNNGGPSVQSAWNGSGNASVSVSASNACGSSPTTILNVLIINANISPDEQISICRGQSANINVSGNASSYIWSPATGLSNASITNPVATPSVTTQYTVSTNGVCHITDTITIHVLEPIKPSFVISAPDHFVNTPITFINTTNDQTLVYSWDLDAGSIFDNQYNASQQYADTGYYTIILSAENSLHCSDTSIQHIKIIEEPTIYIPNAFTPNNDWLNQLFKPEFIGYTKIEGSIYNRWGTKIYDWNGVNEGWNGKVNGKDVQEDVYIYQIKASVPESPEIPSIILNGRVSLVR